MDRGRYSMVTSTVSSGCTAMVSEGLVVKGEPSLCTTVKMSSLDMGLLNESTCLAACAEHSSGCYIWVVNMPSYIAGYFMALSGRHRGVRTWVEVQGYTDRSHSIARLQSM